MYICVHHTARPFRELDPIFYFFMAFIYLNGYQTSEVCKKPFHIYYLIIFHLGKDSLLSVVYYKFKLRNRKRWVRILKKLIF